MEAQTIAGDVRSRRVAAGLSQLELAQRAGCADSTLRLFDRGYLPVRSEAMARVLAVLDTVESVCSETGTRDGC